MTVFKAFLKVLNKNKFIVILYTAILISFAGINFKNKDANLNFEVSKPDIMIVNEDEEIGITKSLVEYLNSKCIVKEIEKKEDKINDALFYRDVNYVIYIPKNFRNDFLLEKNPEIQVKSSGDYQATLASMILEKFMNVANIYKETLKGEETIIKSIHETLEKEIEVQLTSKLDNESLSNASFYYNFTSYSMLAGCVYVIALILASFKEEKIKKRMIISSMDYKKINRDLLLSNSLLALILWAFYVILSFILVGKIMFSSFGLLFMINSLLFTFVSLSIAFLIGNVIHSKNAINGIVNVIALGSSFLCGAFIPLAWLPDSVIHIAHVLPTYYFVKSNDLIASLETIRFSSLKPILFSMMILVLYAIFFIILANLITKQKRKA